MSPLPPTPAGLAAKLETMSLPEIETFLRVLRMNVKLIQANPPAGRQAAIDLVIASFSQAELISGQKHHAAQPPRSPSDVVLTQTVDFINGTIAGS